MYVPEKIWTNIRLDTLDKLILGLILDGGATRTPADIAHELGTTQKRVSQKINRMQKEGHLSIAKEAGKIKMEVHYGSAG